MASAKSNFTVDEVLMNVLTESGSECSEEEAPSVCEVISSSVKEFYCLRSSFNSFTAFKDEAIESLQEVYSCHRVGNLDDCEKVLNKPVSLRPAIAAEILLWLKLIYRRMSGLPRAKTPWYIKIRRGFPEQLFMVIIEACSKYPSNFGISVQPFGLEFTHKKCLIRDFSKLSSSSTTIVKDMLQKVFKGRRNGCRAEILVSREKPFVLTYDERNLKIVLKCHYGYWNELGYSFHN